MSERLGANENVDVPAESMQELSLPMTVATEVNVLITADSDIQAARQCIVERFPDLRIRSITFLGEGLDNKAYVVNDSWVFRIPKSEERAKNLRKEVDAAALMQKHTTFPVPKYEYVHQGTEEDSRCVAGSQRFNGAQISPEQFRSTSPDKQATFIADAAHFLKDIHSIPTEKALQCPGVYEADDEGMYQWYADTFFPENVLPSLNDHERRKVSRCLEKLLADKENFSRPKKLVHGDLKMEHLFLDPESYHVQGIIDLDPMVRDPDYDFMRLAAELDEASFRNLLVEYGHPDPERCEGKIQAYSLCRYAQKADFFRIAERSKEYEEEWEKMMTVIRKLPD